MPNWVEQNLHVIGNKSDIDAFIRAGLKRNGKDVLWSFGDHTLMFWKLCPLRRADRKDAAEGGDVSDHFRTRTQAMFHFFTSNDYLPAFYEQLPRHWPNLTFLCSVNEELGQFGGPILIMDGRVHNCVRVYDTGYDRRQHRRDFRALMKPWREFVLADRSWRLMPETPWRHRYMRFDAYFDDDFWFFFRTREEMASFKARYRSRYVMRRVGRTWRRTRLPKQ